MVMQIIYGLFLCLQNIWSRIYDFVFVHGKKIYRFENYELVVVDVVFVFRGEEPLRLQESCTP